MDRFGERRVRARVLPAQSASVAGDRVKPEVGAVSPTTPIPISGPTPFLNPLCWPHKQADNSCVSRAAGISLQPVGFWPDHRGEKSPEPPASARARKGATAFRRLCDCSSGQPPARPSGSGVGRGAVCGTSILRALPRPKVVGRRRSFAEEKSAHLVNSARPGERPAFPVIQELRTQTS
jgi:hypothetical protein